MINALEAFQSRLKASGVEGYFAVRENLHLTLAFIGDYGASDEVMDV
jgi:2'-5' RNA ligase